jgi:hypothetical protein
LSIAWSFNFLFFHNFQLYQKLGILELVWLNHHSSRFTQNDKFDPFLFE